MFTPVLQHVHTSVYAYFHTHVTPCSHLRLHLGDKKGGETPFLNLGPQREPYFLVKLIFMC